MTTEFKIYGDKTFWQIFPKVLWAAAFLYAAWILWCMWRESFADKKEVLPHLAAWLLFPPVWFVIEFHFFKRRSNAAATFEAFKHGQELNRNLWAAVSAILLAVYFT